MRDARFIGLARNGSPILDGAVIFKLMDTHGVPLEVLNDLMEKSGVGFDVAGFCRAALASENWTAITIKRRLMDSYDGLDRGAVEARTDAVLRLVKT